ncbi:Poly(A)-specific ribonuclease PARN-like [Thalictrum thalictroides]|uniref:Poly(A)-specific ribonuclease PARN-like n=1 Tax=Thalictrum thalictroides TaxID=46969 RepID=A0A7J6X3W3_THATH|nr:Poly(A)-specific ribonuclease PARN-like [Thalictrum thalictroides]
MVARVLQRRLFCSSSATAAESKAWRKSVKQVTKSNFKESLEELKSHIKNSDFIAISSSKTGGTLSSPTTPWTRVLPYLDTLETAYLKTKHAAEKFQILQFMVCPFSLSKPTSNSNAKLVAYPYNFHLFPRDELSIGMPSYSFSCQTSYLTTMARQGFDFNMCIYDGISYLSRVQESLAKHQLGNHVGDVHPLKSSSIPSISDSIFMERIKARIQHWKNACRDKGKGTDEVLIKSLRKLILGGEMYGSRPCMSIDVCNERQVQIILEILKDFSDDLVPLIIPDKGGGPKAVRVVLTSSKEDMSRLKGELQESEEEQNKNLSGFREVIDVISSSQKPIVAYNCLEEFAFIHSKFLANLPPSMNDFICSLRLVFPQILDVNYLLKEIGPLRKASNIHAAISYLKRQFFVPLDIKIPHQDEGTEGKNYGHNVLFTVYLFAKLSSILKITPDTLQSRDDNQAVSMSYLNIFSLCSAMLEEKIDEDDILINNTIKVNTRDLIFLWGFPSGLSARVLKGLLRGSHDVFSEDFGVQLVDKTCAIVSFKNSSLAEEFLKAMVSGGVGYDALRDRISEGLQAAGYEAYGRVCRLGLWDTDLADLLDKTMAEHTHNIALSTSKKASEVYLSSESIMLNEL